MSRVHVSLPVSNLDRSVAFYEAVFGKQADKRRDDYANFRLDDPGLMLALVRQSTNRASGQASDPARSAEIDTTSASHYGVELMSAQELTAWRERARAAGLTARDETDVTCCYARADKFWLSDPDGNSWEFWLRKADADAMYEPPKQSSCCT